MPLARPLPTVVAELIAYRLRVLGHPLRIRILDELERRREVSVQQLADGLDASQQNTSRHLGILRHAGVVGGRQEGRVVWYAITDSRAFSVIEAVGCRVVDDMRTPPGDDA